MVPPTVVDTSWSQQYMVKDGLALMWVNALQGSEVRIHMDVRYIFFHELIFIQQNISNIILIKF